MAKQTLGQRQADIQTFKNQISRRIFILVGIFVLAIVAFRLVSVIQASNRDKIRMDNLSTIKSSIDSTFSAHGYYSTLHYDTVKKNIVLGADTGRVEINPIMYPWSSTNTVGTRYCYQPLGTLQKPAGYKLGIKLENGGWYNVGTDLQNLCTDQDPPAISYY